MSISQIDLRATTEYAEAVLKELALVRKSIQAAKEEANARENYFNYRINEAEAKLAKIADILAYSQSAQDRLQQIEKVLSK